MRGPWKGTAVLATGVLVIVSGCSIYGDLAASGEGAAVGDDDTVAGDDDSAQVDDPTDVDADDGDGGDDDTLAGDDDTAASDDDSAAAVLDCVTDLWSCEYDHECVKVDLDCCGCESGGISVAINGQCEPEWYHWVYSFWTDCGSAVCPCVYLCDGAVPRCENSYCTFHP